MFRVAKQMPIDQLLVDDGPVMDDIGSYQCDLCDAELVHQIAQLILSGLSAACVDSTTGDFFRSPAMVAIELRKAMVDYITQRSETCISETLLLAQEADGGLGRPFEQVIDDPAEIVACLMEDFAATKRNLLGRVSGWILSDSREDKIDDFVQEMEMNHFWMIDRREAVSEVLVRNLDYKNEFHCSMKFEGEQQLAEHKSVCSFRPVKCSNLGCRVKFCAVHEDQHDSVCAYKVLPCDQKCPEMVLRREMDRHCVTVCTMKLMNCPFYQVGCHSAIPRCTLKEHCRKNLLAHLMCVLPVVHRNDEASEDEWKEHARSLVKAGTI
ncbi:hypothetical protein HPP92_008145 [Vanilla planifolia]|uniref:TRAF-type domain-containing protein n=1 Tax=Vanilla planifolia TaxID=51239 RepID=A0A835R5R4_VANPL|nr:hypothetical protein HPP92_008145 [Vanilla planifolia]